mmetsp:Transcript_9693/g.39440  ORF Transcript_9693/g.39440 Transcript_9693/m.39440 type:complete len:106 (+) Transcript_9693:74-391(+)
MVITAMAIKHNLLHHLLPLIDAVPKSLYSTVRGFTPLLLRAYTPHRLTKGVPPDMRLVASVVNLAPRNVVLARDWDGHTTLFYLGTDVPHELARCMVAATKSAAT